MSEQRPKTVEEAVARMTKAADISASNQAATTWRREREMRAYEMRCFANEVTDAWKAEKAVLDARIEELEKKNARLADMAAVSRYNVGDKLEIDGIRMTVTGVRALFNLYRCYHLVYFNHGELKELEFDDGELDALGAVKVEGDAK